MCVCVCGARDAAPCSNPRPTLWPGPPSPVSRLVGFHVLVRLYGLVVACPPRAELRVERRAQVLIMMLVAMTLVLSRCSPLLRAKHPPVQPVCGELPLVFSPLDGALQKSTATHAIRAARLFNPFNQIVIINRNTSGYLTASSPTMRMLAAYNVTLLTYEYLEAQTFTPADWRGLQHMQQIWPSIPVAYDGVIQRMGYYTRYAYLAAAWRHLGLDEGFFLEVDVAMMAPLNDLCTATGWPDANGIARLDATATIGFQAERLPNGQLTLQHQSWGSVHVGFMSAAFVANYWHETARFDYVGAATPGGGDMRITGLAGGIHLTRDIPQYYQRSGCTAVTSMSIDFNKFKIQAKEKDRFEATFSTNPLRPGTCNASSSIVRKLFNDGLVIPACTSRPDGPASTAAPKKQERVTMPYLAPPEESSSVWFVLGGRRTRRKVSSLMSLPQKLLRQTRVYIGGERALFLHFHANAKSRMGSAMGCFFREMACPPQYKFVRRMPPGLDEKPQKDPEEMRAQGSATPIFDAVLAPLLRVARGLATGSSKPKQPKRQD